MSGPTESETQKDICDIIAKNPGIHLSKIAELLNMKISVAEQYLLTLEKKETIISVESEGYKRYYIETYESNT